MRTALRWIWASTASAAIAVLVAYAAFPWLAARLAPPLLARFGMSDVSVVAERPTSVRWRVRSLAARWGDIRVDVADLSLHYTLAGLASGRLLEAEVDRVSVTDRGEGSGELVFPERLEPLWAALPVDRVAIRRLELSSGEPDVQATGTAGFDPTSFAMTLDVASPALPSALLLTARVERTGPMRVRLFEPGGRTSILDVAAVPDFAASRLALDATVSFEGAPYVLALRLAGADPDGGAIHASLHGQLPWPVSTAVRLTDAHLGGDLDVQFSGTYGEWAGLDIAVSAAVTLEAGVLAVALVPGGAIGYGDSNLELRAAHATVEGTRVDASLEGLATVAWRGEHVAIDASATAERNGDRLRVEATLNEPKTGLRLPFDIDYAMDSGRMELNCVTEWASPRPLLRTLFPDWDGVVDVTAGALDIALAGRPGGFGAAEADGTASLGIVGTYGASPVEARLTSTLDLEGGRLAMRVASGSELQFGPATGRLDRDAAVSVDLAGGTVGVTGLEAVVRAPTFRLGGGLGIPEWGLRVPNAVVQTNPLGVRGSAVLRQAASALEVPIEMRRARGDGVTHLTSRGRWTLQPEVLETLFSDWKAGYDLTGGVVEWDLEAAVSPSAPVAYDASGVVTLTDVSGEARDMLARGASGKFEAWASLSRWGLRSSPIDISRLEVGVPITATSAEVSCCEGGARLRNLRGEVLGGTFTVADIVYDLDAERAAFDVVIEGVSLAAVVALQGDDIEADGTLDGTLPVRIERGALGVQAGRVAARAPGGHIAYHKATSFTSPDQAGFDFALRALSDFTYERLEAAVDYSDDGTLALGVQLRGRNPAIEGGRPIHYNLNVTQNVLDLLTSLRMSDRVSETIEKRLSK